jgi:hypothetical protein
VRNSQSGIYWLKLLQRPPLLAALSVALAFCVMQAPPKAKPQRYLEWSRQTRARLGMALGLIRYQKGKVPVEDLKRVLPDVSIKVVGSFCNSSMCHLGIDTALVKEGLSPEELGSLRAKVDRIIRILNALEKSSFVLNADSLPSLPESEVALSVADSEVRLSVGTDFNRLTTSRDMLIVRLMQEFSGTSA